MKFTSKRQRQITNLLHDFEVLLVLNSQKFYLPPAALPLMAKSPWTGIFLAILMVLFSTHPLLVDSGSQTETEIHSDEIRLGTIANNSPGQVLGHIDTHDSLSIGRQFACAVTENSSVVCWGRTDFGQTGIGVTGTNVYHNMTYVDALNGMGIVEVSAHLDHACALTSQGAVYCWGSNVDGQIGNGQIGGNVLVPTQPLLPQGVVAKSLSQGPSSHTCAISTDGDLYCWGLNSRGQVGNGQLCANWGTTYTNPCSNANTGILVPELISMPTGVTVTSVSVGGEHTCATGSDGGVYCWGSDMNCRVTGGDSVSDDPITGNQGCNYFHHTLSPRKLTMSNTEVTIQDAANLSFVQAVSGWVFSCAMTNSGDGVCWGANTESQQGIGNNSNLDFAVVPTLIQGPSGESMTSMSATTAQACAMYDQTGAYCWGDNWGGNTGDYDGSNAVLCNYSGQENGGGNVNCQDRAAPHQVYTGGNYAAVVMGAANACGLDASNDIHCWGAYAWNNVNQTQHHVLWGTRVPELMQLPGTAKIALDDLDSDNDGLNSPFDLWPEGCPSGWYQDAPNSCDESPPGHYAEESLPWNLVICESGTYQPNGGQTSCIDSTPGYYVPDEGALSKIICPAGSYQPNARSSTCILADPGYMVSTPGKIDQTACNAGRFSSVGGSTECVRAQPGFYVSGSGSAEEVPCPPGSYAPAQGSISCISTSPGQYTDAPASTQPVSCDPGSYQPDFGQSSCLLAPAGNYVSESMASSYQPCLSGHYQSAEGMTGCVTTSPGTYTPGASFTAPLDCSAGTYQPSAGAERCIDAMPGNYVASEGGVEAIECSPGTYQPQSGQSTCLEADAGHYITLRAAKSQMPCPVTTFQPQTGQTACMDAEPGHYADGVGAMDQTPCDAGEYQPSSKSTNCKIVPAGHYSVGMGSIDFIACMPGTYQPTSGMSGCIDADEGNYVGESSQLMQTPCSKGTYQPSTASSECLSADAGYFVESTGATEQTPCEAGSYQPVEGRSNCIYSSINNYVPEAGSAVQTACPSGEHQPTLGQTGCVEKEDEGGLLPGFSSFFALMALVGAASMITSRKQN